MVLLAGGLFAYGHLDNHLAGVRAQRVLEQVLDGGWELPVLNEQLPRNPLSGLFASAVEFPGDDFFQQEADGEDAKEDHHRPKAEGARFLERHGPGKKKGHLEIENDEQN